MKRTVWIINFFAHLPIFAVLFDLVRLPYLTLGNGVASTCEIKLWQTSIVLMPLLIYSTQLALELIIFCCSFKLELQRSITKAVLVLTVIVIVMDFSHLAKEVCFG